MVHNWKYTVATFRVGVIVSALVLLRAGQGFAQTAAPAEEGTIVPTTEAPAPAEAALPLPPATPEPAAAGDTNGESISAPLPPDRLRDTKTAEEAAAAEKGSGSDWVDTRLSFVFADDNVFAGAGETTPSSPSARLGAGNQNLQFYDNVNTRFTGFETLSNLVLYKELPSFFQGLTTEAALHVLLLESPGGNVTLRDSSSYVRLAYRPPSWGLKENISLTGFPVSADRFRLGHVWRLTWGGSGIFTGRAAQTGVPGVKLQITRDRWYGFVGGKTALVLNDLILEQETLYGLLAGGGVDILPTLRFDVSGGYFQKGIVPGLANQGIEAPVNAYGASAQLAYAKGEKVGASIDLRLYRNDPTVYETLFKPEAYPGGVSYLVSLEGNYLVQTLEDPDAFARTVRQRANGAALISRLKINYARFHLTSLYRTLSFIQFDVPGIPPYRDFPDGTELDPEIWVAIGADYHFPRAHFTPGFIVGVQKPAAFRSPTTLLGGNNPPDSLQGQRTVVVRDVNLFSVLPSGYEPEPILSAKTTFRWDVSQIMAAIGELYYTRDPNRTTFRDDATGIAEPTFEDPHALGFNVIIQARF